MKSSKKVLAFALAAAMVVTAVPATNAQAASTAKLSAKKATVYSEGYKTVTVKTPKSWKSVKVTATSNKKSVAKVKKTAAKKIKVTGVKPGTAKVTVKVTYKTSTKKSAKTKTKKLTYTLKVAKVGVALSGDSVVAVGSTTKLTNTKKNSSRAKITYTSSDDTIAKVDAATGVVTGVKAGKATITAKITVGKDSATTTKDVEVKNHVLSTVAQNKLTELTATVTGDTKNLKATDFAIKSEATKVVYPVSKVPSFRCSRDTRTGAAQNTLVVKVAAAAQGSSATTSAMSRRSGSALKPACTPTAEKPSALAALPSGSKAKVSFSVIGPLFPTGRRRHGPRPLPVLHGVGDLFQTASLGQTEHDVGALHALAGRALPQVVDGAGGHNHAGGVYRHAHLGAAGSRHRRRARLHAGVHDGHERACRVEVAIQLHELLGSGGSPRSQRQRHRGQQSAVERGKMRSEHEPALQP